MNEFSKISKTQRKHLITPYNNVIKSVTDRVFLWFLAISISSFITKFKNLSPFHSMAIGGNNPTHKHRLANAYDSGLATLILSLKCIFGSYKTFFPNILIFILLPQKIILLLAGKGHSYLSLIAWYLRINHILHFL